MTPTTTLWTPPLLSLLTRRDAVKGYPGARWTYSNVECRCILPGTVRALATSTQPSAVATLQRLVVEAQEPLELATLLSAAGPQLDEGSLATVVERVAAVRDPVATTAAVGLFLTDPDRLSALPGQGYEAAYLAAVALAPELQNTALMY